MGRAEDLYYRFEAPDGDTYLAKLIDSQAHEEAFLEFKRSSDDGAGRTLSENDLNNLGKALSGFANANGGIIIWGIGNGTRESQHQGTSIRGLADPARFASLVADAVSGRTVPPVHGVVSRVVGECVVTLIPESSNAPHQVVRTGEYFIRIGSSFKPAPHGLLAGLFGRPPRPALRIKISPSGMWERTGVRGSFTTASISVTLENVGSVIAIDPYVVIRCDSFPNNDGGDIAFSPIGIFESSSHQAHYSIACTSDSPIRMPPTMTLNVLSIEVQLRGEISGTFSWTLSAGCGGAAPFVRTFRVDEVSLAALSDESKEREAKVRTSEEEINSLFFGREGKLLSARAFGFDPNDDLLSW